MTISLRTRTVAATAAALCILVLWPVAGQAASKTETLRFFSRDVSMTHTSADGAVFHEPPFPEAGPGDVLDVNSLDYLGNHRKHAARWSASHHLRCTFSTGEPDCVSHVAIGGSLLIFSGYPGTLVNGTGRYQGATGRVLSNKEVKGGSDVVARIHLRAGARSAEPAWERALRIRGEAMNRRF